MLERLAPGVAEEPEADGQAEAKGRGAAAPRPEGRRPKGSKAAKVATTGRTLYLPETLFERINVQAHRKRMTHSEYVTMMLERVVPDYRTARASDGDDAAA